MICSVPGLAELRLVDDDLQVHERELGVGRKRRGGLAPAGGLRRGLARRQRRRCLPGGGVCVGGGFGGGVCVGGGVWVGGGVVWAGGVCGGGVGGVWANTGPAASRALNARITIMRLIIISTLTGKR